jgi:hypothetical protein
MFLVRKILRGARFAALALILLYAGDYVSARFRLPGDRQTLGSVDVQVMWAIRQKNGRIDYQLGDTETRPCLYSLFPHLGYTPCWYLARHRNQVIEVGGVRHGSGEIASLDLGSLRHLLRGGVSRSWDMLQLNAARFSYLRLAGR